MLRTNAGKTQTFYQAIILIWGWHFVPIPMCSVLEGKCFVECPADVIELVVCTCCGNPTPIPAFMNGYLSVYALVKHRFLGLKITMT